MGMPSPRIRRPSPSRWPGLLLLALVACSQALADGPLGGGLSGRVQDLLGHRIPDVEVLVVSPSAGGNPIAAARSDAAGLFSVPGLLPGIYRVAALKGGYLTYLGQVNTRVDSWLDVILRPAAAAAADSAVSLPEDATWALRLPRRSLLREIDAEPLEVGLTGADQGRASRPLPDSTLRVQVEQSFAMRRGPGSGAGNGPGGQGSATRLEAASALGQRAAVGFEASHESFDAAYLQTGEAGSSARQGAADVSVDLRFDAGPDDRVAVKAFFSEQELRFRSGIPGADPADSRQAGRSWGYDAAWSTQLDATSSLELEVDFAESKMELESGSPAAGLADLLDPVSQRSIRAEGSYESMPARDHRLRVDFHARLVDTPLPALRATLGEARPGPHAVMGWSVGLEAQDTWNVSGPFSLVYGLGYRHSLASRDLSLIAPRVGGTWSFERLVMSFLVSYHQVEDWGGPDPDATPPAFHPARPLGFEAGLELPLRGGWLLRGATRSAPIQLEPTVGSLDPGLGEFRPAFLTDGNVSVTEDRLSLIREGSGLRTVFEWIGGRAEGSVAPTLPFAMPFQWLSDSSLRYRNGRLGLRVAASGTDLLLDYAEFAERPSGLDPAAGDLEQQSLELRVAQDLMRLRSLGNWRVLLALRTASLEGESVEEWLKTGDARPLAAPDREMSAGLSVLF